MPSGEGMFGVCDSTGSCLVFQSGEVIEDDFREVAGPDHAGPCAHSREFGDYSKEVRNLGRVQNSELFKFEKLFHVEDGLVRVKFKWESYDSWRKEFWGRGTGSRGEDVMRS